MQESKNEPGPNSPPSGSYNNMVGDQWGNLFEMLSLLRRKFSAM